MAASLPSLCLCFAWLLFSVCHPSVPLDLGFHLIIQEDLYLKILYCICKPAFSK